MATELVLGASLILAWRAAAVLVGAGTLLAAFAVIVSWSIRNERAAECGCLGTIVRLRLDWISVGANAALAFACIAAATQPTYAGFISGSAAPADATGALWACAILLGANYWLVAYARSVTQLLREFTEQGEVA